MKGTVILQQVQFFSRLKNLPSFGASDPMPRRAALPFTSRHRSAVLPLDDLQSDTPDTPHIAGVDGPVKAHGWGKMDHVEDA